MPDIIQHPSPNFGDRKNHLSPDMLVIHYTDMLSAQDALERMSDPTMEVSAHYLIHEDGIILQLVDEEKRAWHAGVSFWAGESDINSCSIGIELSNPGHSNGLIPFPDRQINSLIQLAKDICQRHSIKPNRILGHSDIAPGRKIDPGPLFPWALLSQNGLGIWPSLSENNAIAQSNFMLKTLAKIGYDVTSEKDAISAFQLHYRPTDFSGEEDQETRQLAQGVLEQHNLI